LPGLFIFWAPYQSYSQTPALANTLYIDSLVGHALVLSTIDIDSSRFLAEKALQISRKIIYPLGEAKAIERLGFWMDRNGNYKKAIAFYSQAMKIKLQVNNKTAGWPMGEIGYCYEKLGLLDSALHYLQMCVDYGRKNNSDYDVALGTHRIAVIYYQKGNLKKAMSLSDESLSIAERINKPFILVNILSLQSNIYFQLGDYEKALEYCNRGITVTKTFADKRKISELHLQLGMIYMARNDFEKAEEKFVYALNVSEEITHKPGIINALMALGDIKMELKQFDKALENYKKAYSISKDMKVIADQSGTLNKMGNAYFAMKKFNLAVSIGEQSFKLAKSVENPFLQRNAAEMLWKAYRNLSNFQRALEYHELFKNLTDSVSSAEFKKSLLEKEFTFNQVKDSLRYVREKDLLKLEQEKKDIRQRNIRNLIIAGLVGIMILLLIVNRVLLLRKQKKYLWATVEKRTEQLRVSLTEKEVLLKEIHHRVKNNLEVISSLLMLQTKNITDEKARAGLIEGQSRVQSIALIHHNLYRTEEMGSVELCGFSKDLFWQVKDVFNKPGTPIEFHINETEIWLNTDAAVPFGLILNELFTNAFKYAVESNRENIITVSLEETTADDKTNYTLVFRDNGLGMPANLNVEKSTSLGMKVIQLLTRQLDGNSTFYNDNGTIFELNFPKKNNSLNTQTQKKDA